MAEPSVSPGSSSETQLCSQPVSEATDEDLTTGRLVVPTCTPNVCVVSALRRCSLTYQPEARAKLGTWVLWAFQILEKVWLPERTAHISPSCHWSSNTMQHRRRKECLACPPHLFHQPHYSQKGPFFFSFYFLALHSSQMTILLLPLKMFSLSLFLFGKLL